MAFEGGQGPCNNNDPAQGLHILKSSTETDVTPDILSRDFAATVKLHAATLSHKMKLFHV